VHKTTVREIYTAEAWVKEDEKAFCRGFFREHSDCRLNPRLCIAYCEGKVRPDAPQWFDGPLENVSRRLRTALVSINMDLPDQVLVEHFKVVLQGLRRSRQLANLTDVTTKRNPSNFRKLIHFGALPYLDLRFWAWAKGKKIPNRVMADAIFPPGEGGEEVVRKTEVPPKNCFP